MDLAQLVGQTDSDHGEADPGDDIRIIADDLYGAEPVERVEDEERQDISAGKNEKPIPVNIQKYADIEPERVGQKKPFDNLSGKIAAILQIKGTEVAACQQKAENAPAAERQFFYQSVGERQHDI